MDQLTATSFIQTFGTNMEQEDKQALRNSCELLRQRRELHASLCNCMQAYVTACKLNCIQTYVATFKLM